VKGNETSVFFGREVLLKAAFTLSPTASPKTIDYIVTSGENQGESQLGIYAIEGDTVSSTARLGGCADTNPDAITGRGAVGAVSNPDHGNINDGKAGRTVWRGKRPHNRGVAMNPVDHPHGGGEGKTGEGRVPVDPWGNLTKGYRTRNNKRTQVMVVARRKK
jgi:hypothetical protein